MENNIKGIHHINIQCVGVEHLLKTVDFYKNVLGFKEKRNWKNGEKVVYLLDAGNTSLEISSAGTKPLDNKVAFLNGPAGEEIELFEERV